MPSCGNNESPIDSTPWDGAGAAGGSVVAGWLVSGSGAGVVVDVVDGVVGGIDDVEAVVCSAADSV